MAVSKVWIFWFVTTMHIAWGLIGIISPTAIQHSWMTVGLYDVLGSTLVMSGIFILVGVLALIALIRDPHHVSILAMFLIIPQQFLLILTVATGLDEWITNHPEPGFTIAFATAVMAAIWHTVAIVSTYMIPRSRRG